MADINTDRSSADEAAQRVRFLDGRVMELQALFEISKLLNSSLNLKSILDNILLTPMGKMMISKGMVLLNKEKTVFAVETLKGLPRNLINKQIQIETDIFSPTLIDELDPGSCSSLPFLNQNGIKLLLPIVSNHKNLGFIGFGEKIVGSSYSEQEIEFLNSLSNIAASSIENGLVFREINSVNRRLDKKNQELNTLFEIGKELNTTLDSDKILNLLLFAIMGEMMVNRCAVFLKIDETMQLMHAKGLPEFQESFSELDQKSCLNSLSAITRPVMVGEMDGTDDSSLSDLFHQHKLQVLIPMPIQEQTQGIIAIGEKITQQIFSADELEFLYTLGNQAMISLENARLFEETLEKQRMEEELLIAREIQNRLLPKTCPEFTNLEIAARNVSSRQVGGDYFDCIEIDKTHHALAIGDVSGKGVPASLLMSNAQASLHALVDTDMPVDQMISKINNLIYENTTQDKFITFFYGVLDSANLLFTFCNSGHNPPYLVHTDGTFYKLESGGLLLGMMPNVPYETETVQLRPGDWIVMYTDGVTEAMNAADEEFEEHRLEAVVRDNLNLSATQMIDAIAEAVSAFVQDVPQSDDITMVTLKIKQ